MRSTVRAARGRSRITHNTNDFLPPVDPDPFLLGGTLLASILVLIRGCLVRWYWRAEPGGRPVGIGNLVLGGLVYGALLGLGLWGLLRPFTDEFQYRGLGEWGRMLGLYGLIGLGAAGLYHLASLLAGEFRFLRRDVAGTPATRGYYGPYPLFNTTLNLVGGAALAEQDRKGEAFVLSPDYCGSPRTGYARMAGSSTDPSVWENLTLGRAVTISGAAVDPNMPNYQSAPLTALLAILNVRTGWWVENPDPARRKWVHNPLAGGRGSTRWQATNPTSGRLLMSELIGGTRANGAYVHLSDGGHFENTGAYELIRRRCRYVVVIDAAEDPNDASENLANLMRLVRTDFGIRIDVNTRPLHKDADGLSRAHVAIGVIRYDDVDAGGVTGTLVFIRSSMTGDEPADLKNYAINNRPFPHHSTANQFFDEAQFESYRMLGQHIGLDVFDRASRPLSGRDLAPGHFNRELFAELRQEWTQVTTDQYERYSASAGIWEAWGDVMREDRRLIALNLDIYPELGAAARADTAGRVPPLQPPADAPWEFRDWARSVAAPLVGAWAAAAGEHRIAEFRALSRLVGIMEAVWMQLDLDSTYARPLHRGWMNCFRRWTAAAKFQEYWPILRPQFSWGFVRFCERVLNVIPVPIQWVRWDRIPEPARAEILETLNREFFDEWANVLEHIEGHHRGWEADYLRQVIAEATPFPLQREDGTTGTGSLAWVLTYGRSGEAPRERSGWLYDPPPSGHDERPHLPPFPLGLVAVRDWPSWHPADDVEVRGGAKDGDDGPYSELFMWNRGPYRTASVGRVVLPRLLKTIDPILHDRGQKCLLTRFPRIGSSAAESLQRALWAVFFNDSNFYSYKLHKDVARLETRLRRFITG